MSGQRDRWVSRTIDRRRQRKEGDGNEEEVNGKKNEPITVAWKEKNVRKFEDPESADFQNN